MSRKKNKESLDATGLRVGGHSLEDTKDRQRKGLFLDSLDYLLLGIQPPKDRKVVYLVDSLPLEEHAIPEKVIVEIAINHARQDKQNSDIIHESYPDKLIINGGNKIMPTGGEGFTVRKKREGLKDYHDTVYSEAYRKAKEEYGKVNLDIIEFHSSEEYRTSLDSFNKRHSKDKR